MFERIEQLQRRPNYKEGLRETCRANKMSITILNGLTIKRVRTIYGRTLQHYESNPEKAKTVFFENELRLLQWCLLIESFLTGKLINQFGDDQWTTIQQFFPPKSSNIFEFESKKMLGCDPSSYSRYWVEEQCELLTRLVEQVGAPKKEKGVINRWNEIARQFYEQSGKKFYRSTKQCRQQWFNHLDFSKKHGDWTPAQDKAIFDYVLNHGRKWALMCKELFPYRTEHMIKNRFKSITVKAQAHWKKDKLTQRKLIKKILSSWTEDGIMFAKDTQQNQHIKRQATYSSEKSRPLQEEGPDSLMRGLDVKMPKNGKPTKQIIQQGRLNQQNSNNAVSSSQHLVALPEPVFPSVNASVNAQVMMSPCQGPSNFSSSFTFLQVYPNYFPFMNTALPTYQSFGMPGAHQE